MKGSRIAAVLAAASIAATTCALLEIDAAQAAAEGAGADSTPVSAAPDGAPAMLQELTVRDLPARDRLFDRGIPITPESISPDGIHFAYLHQVPGGFPRRKPERCTFLLDLSTLDNRPVKTPKGRAVRIAGWDQEGRNLLLETSSPHLFSAFTGRWTTYHWIYDVVTSQFVPRKPFTGETDEHRFKWKQVGTMHGAWKETDEGPLVVPLEPGQLAQIYQERERDLDAESRRRVDAARALAVGSSAASTRPLADALPLLDEHWTRRGQRNPVVSELFGERPRFFARRDGNWAEVCREIEYAAVLDHGLVLLTFEEGRQVIFHPGRWEIAPLPPPPEEFRAKLAARWDRAGTAYDENDPLPRDLQYRRAYDVAQGTSTYFNYVLPQRTRMLILYSIDQDHRVLRIVDLPGTWSVSERPGAGAPAPSP